MKNGSIHYTNWQNGIYRFYAIYSKRINNNPIQSGWENKKMRKIYMIRGKVGDSITDELKRIF